MPYAAAVLLDDEIVPRSDDAAALASSLSAGDAGQRETAAWVLHAIDGAAPAELRRIAASDPSPATRFAARWTMPADSIGSHAAR
jgi:hypothetical protein